MRVVATKRSKTPPPPHRMSATDTERLETTAMADRQLEPQPSFEPSRVTPMPNGHDDAGVAGVTANVGANGHDAGGRANGKRHRNNGAGNGKSQSSSSAAIGASELVRLGTWAVDIAAAVRGEIRPQPNGGYRVGANNGLIIHPDGSWHDFVAGAHGFEVLALFRHLHSCDHAEAEKHAFAWLAQHHGNGRLAAHAEDADAVLDDELADAAASEALGALWSRALPIKGTLAETYLASRGLDPDDTDRNQMGWLSNARGEEGALIVRVTDGGGTVAAQLTFITAEGKKSPLSPVRKTFKGRHDWGRTGLVRFGAPGPKMVICEGLEDALSAREAGADYAVALLGLSQLGKVELPYGVDQVVVVRDADEPGSAADQTLWRGVARLFGQAAKVRITARPEAIAGETDKSLKDINDLWQHDQAMAAKLLEDAADPTAKLHENTVSAVVDEASRMDLSAYERCRAKIAKLLLSGWRLTALDAACKARIAERREAEAQGQMECEDDVEPWPDPITDIGTVLNEIVAELSRYVAAPPAVYHTVALWCAFSHLVHHELLGVNIAPRLAIQSATTICGKSTLLECIAGLVPRERMSGSISPAAIFRSITAVKPTLLLDEVDNLIHVDGGRDLLGILNSGHRRRTAFVERVEKTQDGQFEVLRFSTFTAIAFAGINRLPETLQNRSIVVILRRALADEVPEHLHGGESPTLLELRRKLVRWSLDLTTLPAIADQPKALANRKGDNWEWLRRIAEAAASEWPSRALMAAIGGSEDEDEADQNITAGLLGDIWEMFSAKRVTRMSTEELIDELLKVSEGRWKEANRGKEITPYFLRQHLGPVIPNTQELQRARQWKEGGQNRRGYTEAHLEDPWRRYLGRERPSVVVDRVRTSGTSATSGTGAESQGTSDGCCVPDGQQGFSASGPSGTVSGTQKPEQEELVNGKVHDGPDGPDGEDTNSRGALPRGARGRRKAPETPEADGKETLQ